MKLPPCVRFLTRRGRMKRIDVLLDVLAEQEIALRDTCAALIECTDEGDELHMEIRRFLEQLDR